jgi:hypothetical protein
VCDLCHLRKVHCVFQHLLHVVEVHGRLLRLFHTLCVAGMCAHHLRTCAQHLEKCAFHDNSFDRDIHDKIITYQRAWVTSVYA